MSKHYIFSVYRPRTKFAKKTIDYNYDHFFHNISYV